MGLKVANNAVSTLAASITADATTLSIQSGDAANFPALAPSDWYPLVLIDSLGNREILRVTARAGSAMTVVRAAEGTSARAFPTGSKAELRLTSAAINDKASVASVASTQSALDAAIASFNTSLATKASASDLALYAPLSNPVFTGIPKVGAAPIVTSANISTYAPAPDLSGYALKAGATFTGAVNVGALISSTGASAGLKTANRTSNDSWIMSSSGGYLNFYWDAAASGVAGNKMVLDYSGGNLTTVGNVTAYSDQRLKDEIQPLTGALDLVQMLDGVRFTWNDRNPDMPQAGKRDVGLLADQVEAIFPELVTLVPDSSGAEWKTVAYAKLVPVLLEAIKDLAGRVTALEAG